MTKNTKTDKPPVNKDLADVRHGFAPETGRKAADDDKPALTDIAAQLIADIQGAAASEMALLQARAALASDGARRAAMWGAIAGGTILIALLTIIFGIILALTPYVGPVFATLIVGGLLSLLAVLAGWNARRGTRDIQMAFAERGDDVHWDDAT